MANRNWTKNSSKWIFMVALVCCAFWICSCRTVRRIRNNKHHTKIACEGETMNITCPFGYVINIVRANYGRFSLLECNERDETWPDVQCMYPKSTRIMEERCQYKQACHVAAIDETFEDECPETYKYLETTYECRLRSSVVPEIDQFSTEDPSLSAVNVESHEASDDEDVEIEANVRSELQSTYSPTHVQTWRNIYKFNTIACRIRHQTQARLFILCSPIHSKPTTSRPLDKSTASTAKSIPDVTIQEITEKPSLCPETVRRGLKWPATRLNNPAKLACPNNDDAYAEWWCSAEGNWILENPDLSRCISPWARQLDVQSKSIDNEEAMKTLARNLQADTQSNRLFGGDMSASVEVMQHLANAADRVTEINDGDTGGSAFLVELNKYLMETGNNLLQDEQQGAWLDLPPSNQTATADRFIKAIEGVAITTAKRLDRSTSSYPIYLPKITFEISNVQIQDYVKFPAQSLVESRLDSIQVPRAALEKSGGGLEWSKVVFISYDSILGEYMRPEASIVVDNNDMEILVERRIVSRLISASVVKIKDDDSTSANGIQRNVANVNRLPKPVILTFLLKKANENMSNAACVYWRSSDQRWSSDGCVVKKQNSTHVTCACDHLTTFAVLMDVRGLRVSFGHQLALSFITCVGCIISICCCAMAIAAFSLFSGTQYSDRITIHTNLCFCLLIAESIFLFGIAQTQNRFACSIVAGLLHYWFLAAFAWMLLEGVQLYFLLIKVFDSGRNMKPYFYLFGYGMPAIIVGISIWIDYSSYGTSYGTSRHCWLNTDNYFIFSFIGPVVVVLMANACFLIMALAVLCRHTTHSAAHRHDTNKTTIEDFIRRLKGATILVILLGLTWSFGLLYINESTLVMAYAFTILNSLQGCFIFVFHVLLNDKMRKEWNRWIFQSTSWIRSPAVSADYKPPKAHIHEPLPKLVRVQNIESEYLSTPTGMSFGTESTSLITKLYGRQRLNASVRESGDPLLLGNNAKIYEYADSITSDAATNSELCPRYSVSPRPPPNFPPPSPPKHIVTNYSRYTGPTTTLPSFYPINQDRHPVPTFPSFDRSMVTDQAPYASTEAYSQADSERPDSGYSGSAHRPTPPPVPCSMENDLTAGWPTPSMRRVPHHPQRRKGQGDVYEVPMHASVTATASISPVYGTRD